MATCAFRECEPAETDARLRPYLSRYGITRVANLTGLDRVGIPVWSAIRPNSRSLAVSQGKGVTHDAARVSALCEAIETWHAEWFEGPVRISRYDDLRRHARVANPGTLPLARESFYTPVEAIPWVEAQDLLQGGSIWIPFEVVHADTTVPRLPGSGHFIVSTNGLASGNSIDEATFAALTEVIERDSHAVWRAGAARRSRETRVKLESVDDPVCRDLLRRFLRAENDVMIWDITSDLGVPAFRVVIYDRWAASSLTPYPAAYGAAAHVDAATALMKALTEAAQSRLTSIAGARDDLTRASYRLTQSKESRGGFAVLAAQPQTLAFSRASESQGAGLPQVIEWILGRLRMARIPSVARVVLSPPDAPLAVVRIVVPGLEGPSSSPSYGEGRRARRARRGAARRAGRR